MGGGGGRDNFRSMLGGDSAKDPESLPESTVSSIVILYSVKPFRSFFGMLKFFLFSVNVAMFDNPSVQF